MRIELSEEEKTSEYHSRNHLWDSTIQKAIPLFCNWQCHQVQIITTCELLPFLFMSSWGWGNTCTLFLPALMAVRSLLVASSYQLPGKPRGTIYGLNVLIPLLFRYYGNQPQAEQRVRSALRWTVSCISSGWIFAILLNIIDTCSKVHSFTLQSVA